jgi:hypothetical protein
MHRPAPINVEFHGEPYLQTSFARDGFVPDDAPLHHAFRLSPTKVELLEVDQDFFLTYHMGERPRDAKVLDVID